MLVLDSTLLIMLIALVFLAFYVAGASASRIRVGRLYNAISEAVVAMGGKIVGARRGATTAVLSCKQMGVLSEFSIVVGVQSWSNPLTYAVSKLFGRKDLAILRARLKDVPNVSLTFVRKGSPAEAYVSRWGRVVADTAEHLIASTEDDVAKEKIIALHDKIKVLRNVLLLSVGRELPHLQIYFTLENTDEIKALFRHLEKLI